MYRLFVLLIVAIGCDSNSGSTTDELAPRTIYHGGDILTMEGDVPNYVQAIVEENGLIVFTGSKKAAQEMAGKSATIVDLQGKTMLPGFIDGHGHIAAAGFQAASANLLPAPDGEGNSVVDIKRLLKDWIASNNALMTKTGWVVGFGYDDAQLDYYPTKEDLDEVSTEYPIIIIHQSAHLSVLNTKGLEVVGYNAETKDPKGGVIRRTEGTNEPNGVLEETAHFMPLFGQVMAKMDLEMELKNLKSGQEIYASFGYTTGQEGRSTAGTSTALAEASNKGLLFLDVVSYVDIENNREAATSAFNRKNYINHYRIGGVKLSLDGSPQGKTAWLTQPYYQVPGGLPAEYAGYATMSDDKAYDYVSDAYQNDWQILVHVNGDAAIDQFIKAVIKANKMFGKQDRRPVAIHAQTVRNDQLDSFKEEDIFPSLFPMHTFYWGDWHVNSVLGPERGMKISPTATAIEKGLIFSSHHDAPVALPNSLRVLSATVTRVSRSGVIIGPGERVSTYVGLKAMTDWAAYQHFEEERKGTISTGKMADFVILDKNPVKINSDQLIDLVVLETIKEGNTVYQAPK